VVLCDKVQKSVELCDHLSIASPTTVISKDFCMIFSMRSPCFAPFATISLPDPTDPSAEYGESTVAPLREIHAHTVNILYDHC